MLGLVYLLAFLVYLLLSVGVVSFSSKKAKERGIAGWKWGVPAALIMYLIVFWDHIPTLVSHGYFCNKDAGFKIHKTLEQWNKEYPGVAETLNYEDFPQSEGDRNHYIRHLNQRFDSVFTRTPVFLSVKQRKYQVIDISTNEVLAEYIDYSSGGGFQNANALTDYKLWLASNSCENDMASRTLFNAFRSSLEKIKGKK